MQRRIQWIITNGQNALDKVIAKCADPWNNVFKGMGWNEVASMSEQDLKEQLGMP